RHTVNWHWVRGHEGHPENERAHNLAQRGIAEQEEIIKHGGSNTAAAPGETL
ncbi:MAG: RNase H family protein, partial [Rhodomicrobium sp.]